MSLSKRLFATCRHFWLAMSLVLLTATAARAQTDSNPLAQRIRNDRDLADVLVRARALLKSGLNAGTGYPEVWVRDLATFAPLACQVNDPAKIRRSLLLLLRFQGSDGNIPDGVGHRHTSATPPPDTAPPTPLKVTERFDRLVIERPDVPDYVAFKNSVETDQESSLVLAVDVYLKATGDVSILKEVVDGQPVMTRMENALEFLLPPTVFRPIRPDLGRHDGRLGRHRAGGSDRCRA